MLEHIKHSIIKSKAEIREQFKVEIKGIFGSYARGDFNDNSDLDLLVDFDSGATLIDLIGVQFYFEDLFGVKVDIVPRRSLRTELHDTVYSELISL